jgi:hypothetical protein
VVLVAAPLGLAAYPSIAQETDKAYVGAGLSVGEYAGEHAGIRYDDSPVGALLYGGVRVRDNLGIEVAVSRLLDIESGEIPGSGVERLEIAADYNVIAIKAMYRVSLSEVLTRPTRLTVFGSAGGYASREERNVTQLATARTTSVSEDDAGLVLGVGSIYRISRVSLRAYADWFDSRHSARWSLGVAAEVRF